MCLKNSFDYLKAYHQISEEPEMEKTLMLLISDIPSYYLLGLNFKIPEKALSSEDTRQGNQSSL